MGVSPNQQSAGALALAGTVLALYVGTGLASVVLIGGMSMAAFVFMAHTPEPQHSQVVFGPNQLQIHTDSRVEVLDWAAVGRVRVVSGEHTAISIQVAGAEPIAVPMDLEPMEHISWLAATIERRARESRERRGNVIDVPEKIRTLRS